MPNVFPAEEVTLAQEKFGYSAVQVIRSGGIVHPQSGRQLVKPGQIEGLIFSLINMRICGGDQLVTLQFRIVPYCYPESFPTFYLVSPRSYRLIPEVYKRTEPEPAIQEAGTQRRDDPRNVGWAIPGSFARVHFCQLEELWNLRPLPQRSLAWALSQLRGLLRNPLSVAVAG